MGISGPVRLIDRERDRVPGVSVDLFGKFAAISWYREEAESFEGFVAATVLRARRASGVYAIRRYRSSESAQRYEHVLGEAAPEFFEVAEGRSKFFCSFSHGQNAGFFIDNRANREKIAAISAGRRVLNLFSYTGVLSVVAGAAGAQDVVSVDVSRSYGEWAKRNLAANGLEGFVPRVLTFDALDYLGFCRKKGYLFDLVILDPPSFASRLGGRSFSTMKDYPALASAAVPVCAPGGILAAICNTAGMGNDEFRALVSQALRAAGRKAAAIAAGPPMPRDFVSGAGAGYLKSVYVTLE